MTRPTLPAILGTLAVLVAIGAIIGGFLQNGSPTTRRARALDARRVEDLHAIANALNQPYFDRGTGAAVPATPLPISIAELVGRQEVYLRQEQTKDPLTGQPYVYRTKGETKYELCATFTLPTPEDAQGGAYYGDSASEFWTHGIGEKCYEIDATKSVY